MPYTLSYSDIVMSMVYIAYPATTLYDSKLLCLDYI